MTPWGMGHDHGSCFHVFGSFKVFEVEIASTFHGVTLLCILSMGTLSDLSLSLCFAVGEASDDEMYLLWNVGDDDNVGPFGTALH